MYSYSASHGYWPRVPLNAVDSAPRPHGPYQKPAPSTSTSARAGGFQVAQFPHSDFQYSRCTGRKKALCVGINYIGQPHELRACITDAERMYRLLQERCGFHRQDMILLRDDARDPRSIPTRSNVIDAMKWLVKDAKPHDSLFIYYSGGGGPGSRQPESGDSKEYIYPVDYQRPGNVISSDTLYEVLVKQLPRACRLTAVFDFSFSGSILDLPFVYHSDGRIKSRHVDKSPWADVISFSTCNDTRAITHSLAYAFVLLLERDSSQTYQQMLNSLGSIMKKYSDKPLFSSSHAINMDRKFII